MTARATQADAVLDALLNEGLALESRWLGDGSYPEARRRLANILAIDRQCRVMALRRRPEVHS